jgi:hypothetical protein
VEMKLDAGRVSISGLVDIDQVKEHLTLSPWNPLSFLSGLLPVTVAGRYEQAGDSLGRVQIDEVRAGRVPIPVSVIEQIVASSTRTSQNPEGVDIRAPFRLPPPVKRLRITPGRAFLEL